MSRSGSAPDVDHPVPPAAGSPPEPPHHHADLTEALLAELQSGRLRAALDVLRDGESPRAPAPRLSELEGLIDGVRSGGVGVEVDADDVPSVLPGAVELAAYRIVQEALTNVTRHSNARSVAVRLAASDAELLVDVVDDGTAATPSVDDRGRGLIGMRERAASLGGTLTAGPTATGGFRVTAHLPLGTP